MRTCVFSYCSTERQSDTKDSDDQYRLGHIHQGATFFHCLRRGAPPVALGERLQLTLDTLHSLIIPNTWEQSLMTQALPSLRNIQSGLRLCIRRPNNETELTTIKVRLNSDIEDIQGTYQSQSKWNHDLPSVSDEMSIILRLYFTCKTLPPTQKPTFIPDITSKTVIISDQGIQGQAPEPCRSLHRLPSKGTPPTRDLSRGPS